MQVDLSRVGYIDRGSLRLVSGLVRDRRVLGDPATLVVTSSFLQGLLEKLGVAGPDLVVERLNNVA